MKGHNVLNPIGIQMLQLDHVVVEEPQEEAVGRSCKPVIMKVHERHHVAIGWHQEVMAVGHYPLVCSGPRAKKAMVDESLHMCMAAI
jgi:hypothetical protein